MWWMLFSAAFADQCDLVSMADIVDVEAPAVFVLGTRNGTQPDLARATRVARKLTADGEVTVALQAVHPRYQGVLDQFADAKMDATDLPELLDWSTNWDFSYGPYESLVTGAITDLQVVAAGVQQPQRPADATSPTPPGYLRVFRKAIGEHTMPMDIEAHFVQTVAWQDHQIASAALSGWSGEGYLVIVADRIHVEGGLGIPWQLTQLTDAPVHAAIMHRGVNPPCFSGDRLLR